MDHQLDSIALNQCRQDLRCQMTVRIVDLVKVMHPHVVGQSPTQPRQGNPSLAQTRTGNYSGNLAAYRNVHVLCLVFSES